MNKLSTQKRVQVISALVEGMSIRAVVRMTGVAKNTVVKLLEDVGNACAVYQDKVFRNLTCKRIECDEIWSLVHAKEGHLPSELRGVFGYGDVYTWVAIDADTSSFPVGMSADATRYQARHSLKTWLHAWRIAYNSAQTDSRST